MNGEYNMEYIQVHCRYSTFVYTCTLYVVIACMFSVVTEATYKGVLQQACVCERAYTK